MITIDESDVRARFARMFGSDGGGEEYETVCADAAAEIERGEREGCGPESFGPLAEAAASLAFYRAVLANACGGSFEAGGVKIAPGGAEVASARRLWRESLSAAAPYLADTCFLFRRTSV